MRRLDLIWQDDNEDYDALTQLANDTELPLLEFIKAILKQYLSIASPNNDR